MDDNGHDGCPTHWIARSAVGGVATCPSCGNVHLTLEYLTLRLEPTAFRELVGMLLFAQTRMDADRAVLAAAAGPPPLTDKPLH